MSNDNNNIEQLKEIIERILKDDPRIQLISVKRVDGELYNLSILMDKAF